MSKQIERKVGADKTVSAYDMVPITPSDSVEFPTCVAIYVGGDGMLSVVMNSGRTVENIPVLAGLILPIQAYQVLESTTATAIFAMYN